jgi:DNA-binding CsgD family transcriptional regulator
MIGTLPERPFEHPDSGGGRRIVSLLVDGPPEAPLSERETEILQRVAHGATAKEVAHDLGISRRSVRLHLERIFEKLGPHDRMPTGGRMAAWERPRRETRVKFEDSDLLRCSFCGRSQTEVDLKLITGPAVFICHDCVALRGGSRQQEEEPPAPQDQ